MTVQTEMQEQTEANGTTPTTPASPAAPTAYRDSDDELLEQALREADGGAATEGESTTPIPAVQDEGATDAAPEPGSEGEGQAPQDAAPATDKRMVPLAALIGERRKTAELAQQTAYLKGALDAMVQQGAAPSGAAQAQQGGRAATEPTIPEQIAGIDRDLIALAEKIDDGTLTASEARKQEIGLISKRQDLVTAQAVAQIEARIQTPADSPQGSLYLQSETARLEQQHPYLHLIDNDADWHMLEVAAARELAAQGVTIDTSEGSRLLLRQTVAALSDRYGPGLTRVDPASAYEAVQRKTGRVLPRPNAQAAPASPPKQSLAARMPPDPLSVPRGAAATGGITPQQMMAMSDDELARLGDVELERVLSRSG